MQARSLTTDDVVNAIEEQNIQVAAVARWDSVTARGQRPEFPAQYTVTTLGRLNDPKEFENIIIKTAQDPVVAGGDGIANSNHGRITRIKDIARIEMGGKVYDSFFQQDGAPSAGLAIYLLPGANALDVAQQVRNKMEELKKAFPEGMEYSVPFDTTKFVSQAIHEVYQTLFEAGVLVLLVIMIFLQDWRAVMVPATTIPVTIIGTFTALAALGFSINMVTLFGLILAIGIVVDDAIVIVEAATFNIDERHMSPKDATIRAMTELTGPVLSTITVVADGGVCLHAAMLAGITGSLYRQFALTIAASAFISAINALTLKPAQSATYLRPKPVGKDGKPRKKNILFRAFNYIFAKVEGVYTGIVGWIVRHTAPMMLGFAGLLWLTVHLYTTLPTGFLPEEDQGYVIVSVSLPDASSQKRTREVVDKLNGILRKTAGTLKAGLAVGGNSIFDGATLPNAATFYVVFKDWDERVKSGDSQNVVLGNLRRQFAEVQEASIIAFPPPAILGLGSTAGFQMQLQDRAGSGLKELQTTTSDLIEASRQEEGLASVYTTFRADTPQLYADIDRVKAKVMDVPLNNVFGTLQAYLGSTYVNDFNAFGRTYQVRVQADEKFRRDAGDIKKLQVRNAKGNMLPLGTAVDIKDTAGPQILKRYNLYPTAQINGQAGPGFSTGQALKQMEALADKTLPSSMGYEWTGMSYQEKKVGNESIYVFAFAGLLVYLVLAALYESWIVPMGVIFVLPLGLLGAAAAVSFRGMDNNVYTQIGVVLIIALVSKNAILIVEVARELRHEGWGILESAVEAARRRFRPILMTSFAFILGVYPLVNANGAGAAQPPRAGNRGLRRHVEFDDPRRVLRAGVLRHLAKNQRMAKAGSSARIDEDNGRLARWVAAPMQRIMAYDSHRSKRKFGACMMVIAQLFVRISITIGARQCQKSTLGSPRRAKQKPGPAARVDLGPLGSGRRGSGRRTLAVSATRMFRC